MSAPRKFSSPAEEKERLTKKLTEYVTNKRQVESALGFDPRNNELLKLRSDLDELITLTKGRISETLRVQGIVPPVVAPVGLADNRNYGTGGGSTLFTRAVGDLRNPGGVRIRAPAQSTGGIVGVDIRTLYDGNRVRPGPGVGIRAPAQSTGGPGGVNIRIPYHGTGTSVLPGSGAGHSLPVSSSLDPAAMQSQIKTFEDKLYTDFIIEAVDLKRPPEVLRNIIGFVSGQGRKSMKRQLKEIGITKSGDSEDGEGDEGAESKKELSAAWNVPLIYRGDLLKSEVLYLIVKQIRLKPTLYSDHKMVAGAVCAVNNKKVLSFWGIVRWRREDICQTFSSTTGITHQILEKGLSFQEILKLMIMAIDGKQLLGYKLEDDLQALSLSHDRKEDLADYYRDEDGPFSLEDLRKSLPNAKNETAAAAGNNIVLEARTLVGLHEHMQNYKSRYPTFSKSPTGEALRLARLDNTTKRRKLNSEEEVCRCSI